METRYEINLLLKVRSSSRFREMFIEAVAGK